MKKCFTLTVIIFILNSCAVQKKQPYYFSWYTPHSKNSTAQPSNNKELITESNNSSGNEILLESQVQKQPVNGEPSGIELLRPKPRLSKIKVLKKPDTSDSIVEAVQEVELPSAEENVEPRMDGDPILLMTASIIGLGVIGLISAAKKTTTQVTRWAKANPKKSQGLITGMQVPLLALGVMNGYNLNQIGYDVSNAAMYGFGAAAVLGFASLSFLPKKSTIALPHQVNRKRLAVMGITLSSFLLMTGFGNRIEHEYKGTQLAKTMESIDQSVMYASNTLMMDPVSTHAKTLKSKNQYERRVNAAMSGGGAGVLIFLLVLLTCAGICVTVGGFAALASGEVGIGVLGIVTGPLLIWAAVKGFQDVKAKRNKPTQ